MAFVALIIGLTAGSVWLSAAPFARHILFWQPDGVPIDLWAEGDDFQATVETLDGYTVVFDQSLAAYCYAQPASDGSGLSSSGLVVGQVDPATIGLPQHLRPAQAVARQNAAARYESWAETMQIPLRWQALKVAAAGQSSATTLPGPQLAPPSTPTLGSKTGLTLLIDFSDAHATIPQSDLDGFCNGDGFAKFGCHGSVREYYYDVSNGLLTYRNVVTAYIRMTQPKSYYNDTSKPSGTQGVLLIKDALALLKARPDYTSTILPSLSGLTTGANGWVLACNVMFAGENSGVWSQGLWPHTWMLNDGTYYTPVDLGNGKQICAYQITEIGDGPQLGTFCHETGHLLCGYPDLYDYGYDSAGGAGRFCLMNSGSAGGNPSQICAYLKYASGWANITDLDVSSNLRGSLTAPAGPEFNHFYRWQKPGVPTEYFLLENRQQTGRDANLPGSGVAIWHVDELGDRDNQSLTANSVHANYELTLVQADGRWDLEKNANAGDAQDLYFSGNTSAGYSNTFTDGTTPNARWWDGSTSGIVFLSFGANSSTIPFTVGGGGFPPPLFMGLAALSHGCMNTVFWQLPAVSPPSQAAQSGATAGAQIVQAIAPSTDLIGAPSNVAVPLSAPQTILNEDFEGSFPGVNWALSSGTTWGTTTYDHHSGQHSVWCAASTTSPSAGYPANMQAWMVYGPFSLADATSASVNFWFRNQSEDGADELYWMASYDGSWFSGYKVSGNENTWRSTNFDLASVPTYGNLCGQPQVWVAFIFTSNATNSGQAGTFIDDVSLVKQSARADLQVAETSWPASIAEGSATTVRQRIYNAGVAASNAAHAKLFLSTDGNSNPYADWSAGEVVIPPLAAGASAWLEWQFTMPNLGTGLYNVWAVGWVDSQNEVLESNENNFYVSDASCPVSDQPVLFDVQCAADSSFSAPKDSGWISDTHWTFKNLQAGHTYWYRAKAKRGAEESEWSIPVSSQQSLTPAGPVITAPSGLPAPKEAPQPLPGIQLSDPDAGIAPITVTLSVSHGTLALNAGVAGGLAASQITGNGSSTLSATASLDALQTVLSDDKGLVYTGTLNFVGNDSLAITLADNGNNCQGTALSTTTSLPILVAGTIYDAWLVGSFPASVWADPAKEATVWGVTADPDADGLSNIMEYALGLDPNQSADGNGAVPIGTILGSDGTTHLTLTYHRRHSELSLQYIIEVSSDGRTWSSGSAAVVELSATPVNNIFDQVVCEDLTPVTPSQPRFARLRMLKTD